MRKLTQLVVLSVVMFATPAFAEMKIAVLNYQMALLESDAAKRYAVDAEKKFGPQLNRLKTLESDAKRIQDRLVKDGEKMQTAERERLELEFKQKARDFQFQSKELNESKAVADREMLEKSSSLIWTRQLRMSSSVATMTWFLSVVLWLMLNPSTTLLAKSLRP